jgi:hypothetical protein
MKETFSIRVRNDSNESQIDWKVIIAFIPIVFIMYFFHELGHWTFGEFLGNDMTLRLNNSAPQSAHFINESHALWSSIGRPVLTIIQALVFLLIIWITKSSKGYKINYHEG